MEPSPQLAPDIADNADKVTGYLLIIMTNIERHGFDVSKEVRSLVETREDIENLMLEFEDISDQKLSESWSKLTLLTVISGEIVADLALANEEHRQKQEMKLLSTLTEHLYFLILRLGSWKQFCNHVKERYRRVYNQENPVLDADATNLTVKRKIEEIVHHLKETTFFS